MNHLLKKLTIFLINSKRAVCVLVLSACFLAVLFLFLLPNNVPMQWNGNGAVNYYLPKYLAVLILPGLTYLINLMGQIKNSFINYYLYSVFFLLLMTGIFIFISFNS